MLSSCQSIATDLSSSRRLWFSPFSMSELIQNGRLLTLPLVAGDMHSLLPDEDGRRLYVAMKDNLLSTSLDDITQNPRKVRTGGHTLTYTHTHIHIPSEARYDTIVQQTNTLMHAEMHMKFTYKQCNCSRFRLLMCWGFDGTNCWRYEEEEVTPLWLISFSDRLSVIPYSYYSIAHLFFFVATKDLFLVPL